MAELPVSNRPPYQGPVVVLERRPQPADTLGLLDLLSFLMDRCFQLPGTRLRFGVNSLLLFLPIVGDLLASMISLTILSIGLSHYRVPRIVAARMLLNSLLDGVLSSVPLLGNLWDVYFKADTRNVRLLRQYVGQAEAPSTWRHWVWVVSVLVLLAALFALVVTGAVFLVGAAVRALQAPAA